MANDAMDIKESLAAHHVKAPAPSTAATKEERLKDAQAHVEAARIPTGPRGTPPSPGVDQRRIITDPKYGHQVEVNDLALQAQALGPDPAVVTVRRETVGPAVLKHELASKDAPGNITVREGLATQHTQASTKKG